MLRFYLPKTNPELGWYFFLKDGIEDHPETCLVDAHEQADFILIGFRSRVMADYLKHPEKLIVVDYNDRFRRLIDPNNCFLYFKRSLLHKPSGKIFNQGVIPIAYPVKKNYLAGQAELLGNLNSVERPVDVSCFFNADYPDAPWNSNRASVANFLAESFNPNSLKLQIGEVGESGHSGRNAFQSAYWQAMIKSKIIVTCNPQPYEGDHRLLEALSSGALVFVDRMQTPMLNPFLHQQHLIYYDLHDLEALRQKINHYLQHSSERLEIAQQGSEHAVKHHSYLNRIDQILAAIRRKLASRAPHPD